MCWTVGVIRRRFGLGPFTGQLFIHAMGVAGHDVVKYALDTYATDNGASLSCTHDANAWPSERFAGLPAPRADERVVLWVQNSHGVPIPAGAHGVGPYGCGSAGGDGRGDPALRQPRGRCRGVICPDLRWPAQLELRAGRHVVRPRYEVVRGGRTRIAHVNVERGDLKPDPGIKAMPPQLGRGFLLPFPVLPRARFKHHRAADADGGYRAEPAAAAGCVRGRRRAAAATLPRQLPRRHDWRWIWTMCWAPDMLQDGGHAELVYDFREGGEANGWLHALFRFEDRHSSHAAESSFGAHIFNTS